MCFFGKLTRFFKEEAMEAIKRSDAAVVDKTGWMKHFICTGDGNGGEGCEQPLLVSQLDLYQKPMSLVEKKATGYQTKLTFCCVCCGAETDIENPAASPAALFAFGTRPSLEARQAMALM